MLRGKGVHTIILSDYSGIIVIDHLKKDKEVESFEADGASLVQWLLEAVTAYIHVHSHSSVSGLLIEVTEIWDIPIDETYVLWALAAVAQKVPVFILSHDGQLKQFSFRASEDADKRR